MPRIAVDLTPLRTGGENGGAKLLVMQLLADFQQLAEPYEFLLLTAGWNHQELAVFDGPRCQRLCVVAAETPSIPTTTGTYERIDRILHQFRGIVPAQVVSQLLPLGRRVKQKLNRTFNTGSHPPWSTRILRANGVNLLFCPFTAPIYNEPNIPTISIVYDLQHRAYPQFFSPVEVANRDTTLTLVSQKVDAIICISEYTRQTLLTHFSQIKPERTQTIHVCIHSRLTTNTTEPAPLIELGLAERPFMFYPANFWLHKNHRLLLTAYSILLRRRPELDLDLVFTGALVEPEQELRVAVERMGLKDRVHFLGYLSDGQLATVFAGCQFIIYPSLYEGFGIPLLEAFAYGKPVLCSHATSLPEIGGDAALYFDPRKPTEIVQAIESLLDQPQLTETLVERGYQQLTKFDQAGMTRRYVEIFDQILQREIRNISGLIGVFPDGWLGQDVEIGYESDPHNRTLELSLSVPAWLPYQKITIQRQNNGHAAQKWALSRGQAATLHFPINPEGGRILLNISPVFKPKEHAISNDERWLSCVCRSCQIIHSDGSREALFEAAR